MWTRIAQIAGRAVYKCINFTIPCPRRAILFAETPTPSKTLERRDAPHIGGALNRPCIKRRVRHPTGTAPRHQQRLQFQSMYERGPPHCMQVQAKLQAQVQAQETPFAFARHVCGCSWRGRRRLRRSSCASSRASACWTCSRTHKTPRFQSSHKTHQEKGKGSFAPSSARACGARQHSAKVEYGAPQWAPPQQCPQRCDVSPKSCRKASFVHPSSICDSISILYRNVRDFCSAFEWRWRLPSLSDSVTDGGGVGRRPLLNVQRCVLSAGLPLPYLNCRLCLMMACIRKATQQSYGRDFDTIVLPFAFVARDCKNTSRGRCKDPTNRAPSATTSLSV